MGKQKENSGVSIEVIKTSNESELHLPYAEGISAGFPSPALDFVDLTIDLNKHLIKHPSATFFGRVKGNSLKNSGIDDGDLLIIDKSIQPKNGKIAVCYIDGEFTAKRIKLTKKELWLMPDNDDYRPIKVEEENNLIIWGIVTAVIKEV